MAADVSIGNVIGGGERVLREQSIRLARCGHSVSILTRRIAKHASGREEVQGVTEYRYPVDRRNAYRFFRSINRNARKQFIEIQKRRPHGVVNFHQPFTAYAVLAEPLSRKLRKIYTCHSLAHEEFISRNKAGATVRQRAIYWINIHVRRHIEKRCLQSADRIVVLSRFTSDKLVHSHRLDPEKIIIVPGGVDFERFHPADVKAVIRRRFGIPENRRVFLTIRNLVPRMGLSNLIAGFQSLWNRFPEAYLVIGGEGPLRSQLERLVLKLKLQEHVLLAGFIPEEALADAYGMADFFVLPTVELEGFGMVTLEAMASGVPVLGTPVGGTLEIVGGLDESLLSSDTSSQAIADLMIMHCQRSKEQTGYLPDLSRRCRTFAEEHYSWDRNIQRLEEVLRG